MPVLADLTIGGRPRKVVMMANRNGFFYVLDRATGEFLLGKPFVNTTWAKEIAPDGKPLVLPGQRSDAKPAPSPVPDWYGGTNFMSPSYDAGAQAVLRHRARDLRALHPQRRRRRPRRSAI